MPNNAPGGAVRVAHVGFTGSDDDRDRTLAARLWLGRNDPTFAQRPWVPDAIYLNGPPRRDFLARCLTGGLADASPSAGATDAGVSSTATLTVNRSRVSSCAVTVTRRVTLRGFICASSCARWSALRRLR